MPSTGARGHHPAHEEPREASQVPDEAFPLDLLSKVGVGVRGQNVRLPLRGKAEHRGKRAKAKRVLEVEVIRDLREHERKQAALDSLSRKEI